MTNYSKKMLKLYLDTSVPNYLFIKDAKDKRKVTEILFHSAIWNQYEFYISSIVVQEILRATVEKQRQLFEVLEGIDILDFTEEAEILALAYLKAMALPKSSYEDAQHVALATIYHLDAVVSWNFKHLVNLNRVKQINHVNEQMGYKHIEIISPEEVINL